MTKRYYRYDPDTGKKEWSDEVDFISTEDVKDSTGDSTNHPMSQKAVTEALNEKADSADLGSAAGVDVVQGTGNSEDDVMSQKAVSDQLLGVGQTWQDMSGQRVSGVTYTNTTGRAIAVSATTYKEGGLTRVRLHVDGQLIAQSTGGDVTTSSESTYFYASIFAIVPPSSTYSITAAGYSDTLDRVWELR